MKFENVPPIYQEAIAEFVKDRDRAEIICVACGKNEADVNSMICKECKERL